MMTHGIARAGRDGSILGYPKFMQRMVCTRQPDTLIDGELFVENGVLVPPLFHCRSPSGV